MVAAWRIAGIAIGLLGFYVRVLVAGHAPAKTSGRNTGRQKSAVLNTTGMYSLVRHPLYLGNYLMWLGVIVFMDVSLGWTMAAALAWLLYYERIMMTEEDHLQQTFGDSFVAWSDRTPALFPRRLKWVKPALPFSLKTVIKREDNTLFGMFATFAVIDIFLQWLATGQIPLGWRGATGFAAGAAFFLAIRVLRKRTEWLEVEGR
jgi:hypothetical protein